MKFALVAVAAIATACAPQALASPIVDYPTDPITAAGGTCYLTNEGQMNDEAMNCTLRDVQFQIAPGWVESAGVRGKACSVGYINARYQVLTDGNWMVLTDFNRDLPLIQSTLAAGGVQSQIANYCP